MAFFTALTATSIATGETFKYPSVSAAAREGGFDRTCIHGCIHGHRASHNGFTFKADVKMRQTSTTTLIHKIADLMNQGLDTKQIAAEMRLSVSTVRNRVPAARRLGLVNEVL